jgi:hypothetical protein
MSAIPIVTTARTTSTATALSLRLGFRRCDVGNANATNANLGSKAQSHPQITQTNLGNLRNLWMALWLFVVDKGNNFHTFTLSNSSLSLIDR